MPVDIFDPRIPLAGNLRPSTGNLGGKPIYRVPVNNPDGAPGLALCKGDGFPPASFEIVANAYLALTPDFPRTRLMKTDAEKRLLRDLIFGPLAPGAREGDLDDPNANIDRSIMAQQMEGNYSFYLMEWRDNVKSVAELIEGSANQLNLMRDSPHVFRALGRILALDLFFSNNDRIVRTNPEISPGITQWIDSDDARWCLRLQNVFFLSSPRRLTGTFSGIDFLSPNCEPFDSLDRALDDQKRDARAREGHALTVWPGKYLKRAGGWDKTRPRMAREITGFFNRSLQEKGRPVRYMADHTQYIDQGLEDGRNALKAHLRALKTTSPRGVPVGLKDRMRYLNWW